MHTFAVAHSCLVRRYDFQFQFRASTATYHFESMALRWDRRFHLVHRVAWFATAVAVRVAVSCLIARNLPRDCPLARRRPLAPTIASPSPRRRGVGPHVTWRCRWRRTDLIWANIPRRCALSTDSAATRWVSHYRLSAPQRAHNDQPSSRAWRCPRDGTDEDRRPRCLAPAQ